MGFSAIAEEHGCTKTARVQGRISTGVLTDIMGVSGRAILQALVAGETTPERLADLVRGPVKASRADLIAALHGRVTVHHRFLLKLHLTQIEALEAGVREMEAPSFLSAGGELNTPVLSEGRMAQQIASGNDRSGLWVHP